MCYNTSSVLATIKNLLFAFILMFCHLKKRINNNDNVNVECAPILEREIALLEKQIKLPASIFHKP